MIGPENTLGLFAAIYAPEQERARRVYEMFLEWDDVAVAQTEKVEALEAEAKKMREDFVESIAGVETMALDVLNRMNAANKRAFQAEVVALCAFVSYLKKRYALPTETGPMFEGKP